MDPLSARTRATCPDRPVVVLVNLGTPDAPTPPAVRRYLREFLRDRRVVETHPAIWWPILELAVLSHRHRTSAAKYATIWTERGSPLAVHTESQARMLGARLGDQADVVVAMRYGNPALGEVLTDLTERGRRRLLVVPLYPQYSSSSAGTVHERALQTLAGLRTVPELRTVQGFPTHAGYIEAVCAPLERRWAKVGRPVPAAGHRVVLSFHSIPEAMVEAGDPYPQEVEATARAIRERLGLDEHTCLVTYQSVFGPATWIGPATIDTVAELGKAGVTRLEVVCPGFVSDCLETLEEIVQLNAEAYEAAGGADFTYVPWGNDEPAWVDALTDVVQAHLAGWAEPAARPVHEAVAPV